jgi:hypothetical protein
MEERSYAFEVPIAFSQVDVDERFVLNRPHADDSRPHVVAARMSSRISDLLQTC